MANSTLLRDSAILWIKSNTTIPIDDPLPANVELFIEKYKELFSLRAGVASESISGLSQSFTAGNASSLLRRYAAELLGEDCLTFSDVKAFPALDKWVY